MIQRVDWVFVCGMMRSGSTVLYEITKVLIGHVRGVSVGYAYAARGMFPELYATYNPMHGVKVVKAHAPADDLIERLFAEGRAAGIYSYRNMRAAIVSMGRFQQWDFDNPEWMIAFCQTQLEHQAFYTQWPTTLVLPYGQIRDDLQGTVAVVADWLGIGLTDGSIARIARRHSIDAMRAKLVPGHVADGSDDWFEYVTPEQAALIDQVVDEFGGGIEVTA